MSDEQIARGLSDEQKSASNGLENVGDPTPGTPGIVLYVTATTTCYMSLDPHIDWNNVGGSTDSFLPVGTSQRKYIGTLLSTGSGVSANNIVSFNPGGPGAVLSMYCPLFGTNTVSSTDGGSINIQLGQFNTQYSPLYVNVTIIALG